MKQMKLNTKFTLDPHKTCSQFMRNRCLITSFMTFQIRKQEKCRHAIQSDKVIEKLTCLHVRFLLLVWQASGVQNKQLNSLR